jgi:hypothetical protein
MTTVCCENQRNLSNIPAAPAYGVYISQLIRYSRACGSYHDFLDRGLLIAWKLLNQGFLGSRKSKDRQYIGQKKDKMTNNDIQNTIQKTKD